MAISFDLTPEQEEIRNQAREFAAKEIAPIVVALDETDDSSLVVSLIQKMAQTPYRYTGALIPEEYGGYPRGVLTTCIITEELTAVSQSAIATGLIEVIQLGTTPIIKGGNEEQKKKYVPPVACGKGLPCFALTEPGTGSDAAAISTRAILEGDHYSIKRKKALRQLCSFS